MSSVRRLQPAEGQALRLAPRRPDWSATDDAVLRARYGVQPTADLAADLGRTTAAVWARARTIGLGQPQPTWSPEEDHLLIELAGAMPRTALAARLGRSPHAVDGRLRTLGLSRERTVAHRYQRDQDTIARLREENARLRDRPPPDAAHAPSDDARRLAVLVGLRLGAISPAEAAVALGVPVERLRVEVGKAALRGLAVVREVLDG